MVTIAAVGDICLGDHYFNVGHGMGSLLESSSLGSLCTDVVDIFAGSDIVFGNLESPLRRSNEPPTNIEDAAFVGRASVTRELAQLGFNALNVANNHILQHGEEIFHETISSLIASGISPVGLVDQAEYYCKPVRFTINERVVALLGYSDVNEVYGRTPTPYAQFDPKKITADIHRVGGDADLVVVSLHFGTEGIALPTSDAIRKARWLIDSGANVVLGHHPHVFQPVEKYNSGLIVYSMGNFIFDLFWRRDYIESAIVKLMLNADGDIDASMIPILLSRQRSIRRLYGRDVRQFMKKSESLLSVMREQEGAGYDRCVEKLIGRSDRYDAVAKLLYFLGGIAYGRTGMKVNFLRDKIFKKLGIR